MKPVCPQCGGSMVKRSGRRCRVCIKGEQEARKAAWLAQWAEAVMDLHDSGMKPGAIAKRLCISEIRVRDLVGAKKKVASVSDSANAMACLDRPPARLMAQMSSLTADERKLMARIGEWDPRYIPKDKTSA